LRLNLIEHLLINNPIRPVVQQWLEAPQLLRMGGQVNNARVLEIGCGTGAGIDLIFSLFGAGEVDAFDLNPMAVGQALRRLDHEARPVRLWAGNVRQIPVASERYDAVFGFGVLHHVHRWREALAEIRRVLKPGGRFYCEEITKYFITHPLVNRILVHPQEDRFDGAELSRALEQNGFIVRSIAERFNLYAWIIADKPD